MTLEEMLSMPTNTGRNGIHISAQLRVDAMMLRASHIDWAADSMERAAKHIDALENALMSVKNGETAD